MGEEIGLTVRAKIKSESGGLDKLQQDVKKNVKAGIDGGLKNAKLPTDGLGAGIKDTVGKSSPKATSSPLQDLFGSISGGKSGGGGMAGILGGGGGMMAALGPLAALAIIGQSMVDLLKKVVDILMQASPLLQAQMTIMRMGFMQILRPIGDALAYLLMPVSMFFRILGLSVARKMQAEAAQLKAEGKTPSQIGNAMLADYPQMFLGSLVDTMQNYDWTPIMQSLAVALLEGLGIAIGAFGVAIYIGLATLQQALIDGLRDVLIMVVQWIANSLAAIPGLLGSFLGFMGTALGQAAGWIGDALGGLGSWLWKQITDGIGSIASFIGGAAGSFGAWLWNGITGALGDFGNILGDLATLIYHLFNNLIASLINIIRDWDSGVPILGKPFTFLPNIPMLDTGGDVLATGLAVVHRGETVLNARQTSALGGGSSQNVTVEVHIHGDVYGVDDLNKAIRKGIDNYASARLRGC